VERRTCYKVYNCVGVTHHNTLEIVASKCPDRVQRKFEMNINSADQTSVSVKLCGLIWQTNTSKKVISELLRLFFAESFWLVN